MHIDPKIRKCAYLLADRHLSELPVDVIVSASPRHYGLTMTDDHKLFMWNSLVDHYMLLSESELWQLFDRHITQKEPIVKHEIFEPLPPDMEEMVSLLVDHLWNVGEKEKLMPRRLLLNENED